MNTAIYGSLPASACTLSTQGSFGPDRITKNIYDVASQVTQVQEGVGTADAANERTLTYTSNGLLSTLKDAENNLTTYEYDGFDRLSKTRLPNPTKGSGTSSTTDFEQLTYDANGNVLSKRLRDGQAIGFGYDDLNRLNSKDLPGSEWDEGFGYDNLGRLTSAIKCSAPGQCPIQHSLTYDALGRQVSEAQIYGSVARQFDLAGRMTRLTWPDGFFVDYDRLVTGEIGKVRENGASTGVGVLATYAYDNLGNRTSVTFGNGTVDSYGYDPVSRLSTLGIDLAGTSGDLTRTFAYNPASQIVSETSSNDAYAFTGHVNGSTSSTANGLNQLASVGGGTPAYDGRGNLTFDPATGKSYGYQSQNELKWSGAFGIGYDAFLRPIDTNVNGAGWKQFVYDGDHIVLTYTPGAVIAERYVRGDGPDEIIASYDGVGTSGRRFLHQDERGSVIATSDSSGNVTAINRYDEYGVPASTNIGRFQYTGQMWMPEAGLYHYKARMYLPGVGFTQTDPAGFGPGMNLYEPMGSDPVNLTDPTGMLYGAPSSVTSGAEGTQSGHPRVWDWMGLGATHVGGRLDEIYLDIQLPRATAELARMSAATGVNQACLLTCSYDYIRSRAHGNSVQLAASGPAWFEIFRAILGMKGDSCPTCNQVTFPTDRSNLRHIFSGESGHFGSDTPQNRALILGTIGSSYYVGTNKYGIDIYRQILPNGAQVWVEVHGSAISNAGLNRVPIYGY